MLPTNSEERKKTPLYQGLIKYFPRALIEVAKISYMGSKQHHPDDPVWWDKTKSTDHEDCLLRHLLEKGTLDIDGTRHSSKVAWRALAMLETELEKEEQKND
jgi:hypothetical protein